MGYLQMAGVEYLTLTFVRLMHCYYDLGYSN